MNTSQKPVSELIQDARRQLYNKHRLIQKGLVEIAPEQFKELFILRANEAMMKNKNFGEFIIDDTNREVINTLYFWMTKNENSRINNYTGIIINGKYGSGKSVLMSAFCKLYNDLSINQEYIKEMHSIELVELIRRDGLVPYSRQPLLIQDIGKESSEVNQYGTVFNPLSQLLALRSEYGSMTFGTTNMSKKSFTEVYKEFIGKRITEHVNLVFLKGDSRRPDYSLNQPK